MAVRVTQVATEALYQPTPNARVTQALAETLITSTGGRARVTQDVVETLVTSTSGNARVTQAVVEILIKR